MKAQISTKNVKPLSVSTASLAAYTKPADTIRYGEFLYGSRVYGTETYYSLGQSLPNLNTTEV